jgi:hypothetical protein
VLAIAFVGFFVFLVMDNGEGYAALASTPLAPNAGPQVVKPALQDLFIPWGAGVTLLPVLPLCLTLLAFLCAAAPRAVVRAPRSAAPDDRRRARALADYTAAPLLFLFPAIALLITSILYAHAVNEKSTIAPLGAIIAFGVAVSAVIVTLTRAGQWVARVRRCSTGRAALGAAELLTLWAAAIVLCTVILPWAMGFLWIALDSLRQ